MKMWKKSKECQKLMIKTRIKQLNRSPILTRHLLNGTKKKVQRELASWASVIYLRDSKKRMVCESLRIFCFGGGHLSGGVKITPGKWILRVCHPKVDNTAVGISIGKGYKLEYGYLLKTPLKDTC